MLRSVNENVAIIAPVKRRVRQGGKRFSEDDPFWEVVGIGQTAEPTNIATHKASYVQGIYQSAMTVVRVSVADERRAWEIIGRYSDKNFSFTDATSFAVMERLHIQHVFTLDRDFVQYGFISLIND